MIHWQKDNNTVQMNETLLWRQEEVRMQLEFKELFHKWQIMETEYAEFIERFHVRRIFSFWILVNNNIHNHQIAKSLRIPCLHDILLSSIGFGDGFAEKSHQPL